ncbi:SspB family protein [Phyllobacterium lublinensis]|uniref:SspB family protein n=1 Tax=Phyllobacterium lublinensis TaxID=2875708 RepID=UPI001CC9EB02|nr:SspB family protein [Phyllobacterium sp. 2063]MBZ9656998.1 SspB family protein [Phyllobacterium sp. 2063]
MPQDMIRYDILAQEALRGVIRKVLGEVAKAGLPGNHHFFVTFLTGAPGVRISTRLHEKYPEQMTIVLQHQFWDLQVTDTLFEVGLSFGDVPERLVVPFSAIRGFYDPSVNFELEFDVEVEEAVGDNDQGITSIAPPQSIDKPKVATPSAKPKPPVKAARKPAKPGEKPEAADESGEKSSASVVSLDSFRKKK